VTTASFAFLGGLIYLGLGLLGMLPSLLLQPAPGAPELFATTLYGYLFGALPVNAVLSALHAAIGMWGIVAWSGAMSALSYARMLALIMGVLTLMGLLSAFHTAFGLMPLHGVEAWLHGITGLAAAYFGFRSTTHQGHAERRRNQNDRRQDAHPVGAERRHGLYDRRHGAYGGTLAAG
jgi:hypothetical protein